MLLQCRLESNRRNFGQLLLFFMAILFWSIVLSWLLVLGCFPNYWVDVCHFPPFCLHFKEKNTRLILGSSIVLARPLIYLNKVGTILLSLFSQWRTSSGMRTHCFSSFPNESVHERICVCVFWPRKERRTDFSERARPLEFNKCEVWSGEVNQPSQTKLKSVVTSGNMPSCISIDNQ